MVITHLSHFGLEKIGETKDTVIFSGSLANCKRLAFAHGMEVEKYEGYIVSSDSAGAVYTPADGKNFSRILFKTGGMIQKCQTGYALVMPVAVWNQPV